MSQRSHLGEFLIWSGHSWDAWNSPFVRYHLRWECSPNTSRPEWQNLQSTSCLLFVRLQPCWLMMAILPSLLHFSMANPWTLNWNVPFPVWKSNILRNGRDFDNYLHPHPWHFCRWGKRDTERLSDLTTAIQLMTEPSGPARRLFQNGQDGSLPLPFSLLFART